MRHEVFSMFVLFFKSHDGNYFKEGGDQIITFLSQMKMEVQDLFLIDGGGRRKL